MRVLPPHVDHEAPRQRCRAVRGVPALARLRAPVVCFGVGVQDEREGMLGRQESTARLSVFLR